jgi:hypothetical protein
MSTRKPLRQRRVTPLILGALLAAGAGLPAVGRAGDCDGCPGPSHHCPGPFIHHMERPPCIKFKCVCPRPVCPPCDAEFWGYYPTCWRRWPAMFANCPERTPPWVAVAPPGVPAGYSNSLMPRAEPGPGTAAPAAPAPGGPAPAAPMPGTGPRPPGSLEGAAPGAGQVLPGPATSQTWVAPPATGSERWSSALPSPNLAPLPLTPSSGAAVR